MSSPVKTWTVVCFPADNSVEAVPTRWITGDECLWPPVPREKLNILIKKCEMNTCWPPHKIRPFRNATYDDYTLARKKASKAELTSDLNTDGEVEDLHIEKKRARKPRVLSTSESSEGEKPSDEPKPKKKKTYSKSLSQKMPRPPLWTTEMPPETFMAEPDIENMLVLSNENDSDCEMTNNSISYTATTSNERPIVKGNQRILQQIQSGTPIKEKCCCNPQLLYNIQSLVLEIHAKVMKGTCSNRHHNVEKEEVVASNILLKSNLQLPLTTREDMNAFENFFAISENYLALVLHFEKMGGTNLYEFIRRCVAGILCDKLAEQFSFLGKKNKATFATTSLAKALIDAAQKSGQSSNRKEIEQRIGDWLRRAKERNLRVAIKNNNN